LYFRAAKIEKATVFTLYFLGALFYFSKDLNRDTILLKRENCQECNPILNVFLHWSLAVIFKSRRINYYVKLYFLNNHGLTKEVLRPFL
jgi:hypothetical protein